MRSPSAYPALAAALPDGPGGESAPWLRCDARPRAAASVRGYLEVLGIVGAITGIGWFAPHGYRAVGHVYLLAVMLLCLRVSAGALFFAAVLSALAWNFVLVPPRLSFSVVDFSDLLMVGTYFAAALVGGLLMAQLREQERAAESDRLATALLDSVSHELKTPLAVLRSAAEGLEADLSGARLAHLSGEIRAATQRLDRLIVNLLHQTRLEAGVVAPRFDVCDVGDIIAGARRAADAALAGREVTVELTPELPALWADGVMLETAVLNLLLNAATHTPPGAPVAVRATAADPRWVVIEVADRGPGIAPGERENVFRKFHRGVAARPGGAGLGLSIVRGFVHAHGGQVGLDDNPGGGARFSAFLPAMAHEVVPEQ